MNMLDRVLGEFAPGLALKRALNRAALDVLVTARYDAASRTGRTSSWKPTAADADVAGMQRQRLAAVARDMIRNTPLAVRAQSVIVNNVVGAGIIPKIIADEAVKEELLSLVEAHLDTTAIDADGRNTLYGLQRIAMNAVVDAGEVLIRRRRRDPVDGLPLPFQVQVLEIDYLDGTRDGITANGNEIRDGIEYDLIGRRVAYWLYAEHPGGGYRRGLRLESRRVPASEILHVYRQDRPGQMRGVSWFAAVALSMQDLHDHQDAQLMRQKIAACFAAFRTRPEGGEISQEDPGQLSTLIPGRIQTLEPGESIAFADPPGVSGYDQFTASVLRSVAGGMGITYEALSGDLSGVNFSSARMGRMEMDRNIVVWQKLLLIPQMMQPIGAWMLEAWALRGAAARRAAVRLEWVPPYRTLIDPTREVAALKDQVRSGFKSQSSVIRELGDDPERVFAELAKDMATLDALNLALDTDARRTSGAGVTQARPAGSAFIDEGNNNV